jgi:hypothetical protein
MAGDYGWPCLWRRWITRFWPRFLRFFIDSNSRRDSPTLFSASRKVAPSVGCFHPEFYCGVIPRSTGVDIVTHSWRDRHDIVILTVGFVYLLSAVLATWCDVLLVIDAVRLRKTPLTADRSFPRPGDWAVWFVFACMSILAFWWSGESVSASRRILRADILAQPLVFALVTGVFDVALVIQALKIRHVQLRNSEKTLMQS